MGKGNKLYGEGDEKRVVEEKMEMTTEEVKLKTLQLAQSQLDNHKRPCLEYVQLGPSYDERCED